MPTSRSKNRRIGITLGDPAGIGPEITAKALSKKSAKTLQRYTIIGCKRNFARFGKRILTHCTFVDANTGTLPKTGKPTKNSAIVSVNSLDIAVKMIKNGDISSLITAPVCKESIIKFKPNFTGHTEFLARAFRAKDVGMMFVAGGLKTIIVTRHIPLSKVSASIKRSNVLQTIKIADRSLRALFKIKKPVIAVCGLNPHAGEGGSLGREEITKIKPAMQQARRSRIDVRGPFAADTLFSPTIARSFDVAVAMYHDQGLIPVKSLYLSKLVNLTVGLPFIRTSPAHGTAFDIAGKGKADPSSMSQAIRLANQLSL